MELFQRVRRQAARLARKPFVYRFHRPDDLSRTDFPCAGMQKIWESHIEAGSRNNRAIRLASEFRLLGLTSDEIEARLCSRMIETASNCRRSNWAALCVRHFNAAFPIAIADAARLCGVTVVRLAPLTSQVLCLSLSGPSAVPSVARTTNENANHPDDASPKGSN